MLGFSQYLVEARSKKEAAVPQGEYVNPKVLTAHRGKLNEIAFAHVFDRYNQLMQKHKGNHEKALAELTSESHLDPDKLDQNHPFKESLSHSQNLIGRNESDRTLWDSHHAALATLNHIHHEVGDITGPAIWAGPDVKGGKAEEATGVKTQADIIVPTRNGNVMIKGGGHVNGSLKYSADPSHTPTKMFQGTARDAAEYVQKHHEKNFGKRDKELDDATSALEGSFGGVTDIMNKNGKALKAAGVNPDSKESVKLLRYAHTSLNDRNPAERARTHAKIVEHMNKKGVPTQEHQQHIANLASVYPSVTGSKTDSSQNWFKAFKGALSKSLTKGTSGQQNLLRSLSNVKERRKARVMIIKTQRSKGDHNENPEGSMPKVSIGNHANDFEATMRRGLRHGKTENQLYDATGGTGETSTAAIRLDDGKTMLNFGMDKSKGTPSVIAQAGNAIDNFKDISNYHPSRAQGLQRSRRIVSPQAKLPHPQKGTERVPQTDSPMASVPNPGLNPESDHGGRSFYTPQEKLLMKGHQ